MLSLIRRMLDPNDRSIELHDVAGVGSLIGVFVIAGHAEFSGHPVDPLALGGGASAVIGAIKAAGWMAAKVRATDATLKGEDNAAAP